MAVLIVLLMVFAVVLLVQLNSRRSLNVPRAGCLALAAMFLFAGVSDFLLDDGIVQMLPEWIPLRYPVIYVTGVMELAMGTGFLWPLSTHTQSTASLLYYPIR